MPLSRHADEDSLKGITFRGEILARDVREVRRLIEKTGFFRPDETAVAAELVLERFRRGPDSGYCFIMAEKAGQLAGYACYGPIACTVSSFDLYWIAVDPRLQGKGLGKALLFEAERLVQQMGGTRIYVETSSRDQYKSTRHFYERCGYEKASVLVDFYGPGDSKVTYLKAFSSK